MTTSCWKKPERRFWRRFQYRSDKSNRPYFFFMSTGTKRNRIVIALVGLWVVFTVTLAGWWMVFGLRQLDLLNSLRLEGAADFHRHYRMLLWEGAILIVSLIGGGLALFYYARREQKRHGQVEEFFAAFT